jgi:hypothetical protein
VPFPATIRIQPNHLSSATAHPEQVEAPEGNEDQGARAYAQQQYDCFQHDRITPLVSQKACTPAAKLSSFSCGRSADETIFWGRRKHPETKDCVAGC